jgi:hypothetical protein
VLGATDVYPPSAKEHPRKREGGPGRGRRQNEDAREEGHGRAECGKAKRGCEASRASETTHPKTASLFDMPAPAPPATPPVAGTTPERDEEDELLDELEEKEDGRPADEYDEAA